MIYTMNLSDNFTDKIVEHILSQSDNPLAIAQTHIILPTKRACRTLKEAFVRRCQDKPLLLPKMTALYEIENISVSIPEAISQTERLFLLTRLCMAKPHMDTLDKALKMAVSLTKILDECYLFEVDLNQLETLVPHQELAVHWNESIEFLNIIRTNWPLILQERGKIDIMDRRVRLFNLLARQIEQQQYQTPLILAGLDGSIPAVKKLIKTASQHKNALILFDGLNNKIEIDEWDSIHANHYQYTFKRILKHLKLLDTKVPILSIKEVPHEQLIHEALKPADQTFEWRDTNLTIQNLQNVHRFDCENLHEEALTIATILRQVLETPEKTAALVTNDRNLARRVILEMKRWGIELDDSAGTPLHHTPVGIFLSLLADYGQKNGTGQTIRSLLKHPLAADGLKPNELRLKIRIAEQTARSQNKKLSLEIQTDTREFLSFFKEDKPVSFQKILLLHLQTAEQLATSSDRTGIERLWQSDAGETAYHFFTDLIEHADIIGEVLPSRYTEILTFLMSSVSIRAKYGMHPRLDILGPIEARFSHPDVCIIGGLNEGIFPSVPDTGPWLSRQMRHLIGLPSPEADIGTQSMDFAHCFCASEVYLTRSLKADGSQTIPSRFISRLEAVLSGANINWQIQKPIIARLIDCPTTYEKTERPSPVPSKELRPTKLSVTNIKRLVTNPYGIYARYILRLFPLNELEQFSDRSMYGTALHKAFEKIIKENGSNFDYNMLLDEIELQLKELNMTESTLNLYRPRLKKVAQFVVEQQRLKAPHIQQTFCETEGQFTFPLEDGTPFTLTAKADRIDFYKNKSIEIIDYKTGSVPSIADIHRGYEPQLPLEGLIAMQNGFSELPHKPTDISLKFWKVSGTGLGGTIQNIVKQKSNLTDNDIIQSSFEGLKHILNAYNNDTKPYEAHVVPNLTKYDDYEHLARVKEWLGEDEDGDNQ